VEVLILLVFVSLGFVAGAVAFFAWNVREGTHQHADRLALLPLEDDEQTTENARELAGMKGALDGPELSRGETPASPSTESWFDGRPA
jgi:nitrogen fixation-related uncharacterized protein